MFSAIADGFRFLFAYLNTFGLWILQGLTKLIQPILDFLGGIFYFIYNLGVLLVKVTMIVVGLAKLLIGIVTGLFKTFLGLSFTGRASVLPDSYQSVFDHLKPLLGVLQLDKVAYLFIFGIWIYTGWAAMRIIGNMRGGV